jgi:hypothetical protein
MAAGHVSVLPETGLSLHAAPRTVGVPNAEAG